jgi:hypothetical protein
VKSARAVQFTRDSSSQRRSRGALDSPGRRVAVKIEQDHSINLAPGPQSFCAPTGFGDFLLAPPSALATPSRPTQKFVAPAEIGQLAYPILGKNKTSCQVR